MLVRLRKDKKGFTLVELIVVIAILGVLAMLIVPRIVGNVSDARDKREISNARTLASEITVYNADREKDQWIKSAAVTTPLVKSDYRKVADTVETATGLELPKGIDWPDPDVVEILVDANGNASINTDVTP